MTDSKKAFLKKLSIPALLLASFGVFMILTGVFQCLASLKSDKVPPAVVLENGNTVSANDGAYVYATGKPVIKQNPVDPETGFTADAYMIERVVEMYQYTTDGYDVYGTFANSQLANIKGNGEDYQNPLFPDWIENAVFVADVRIGGGNMPLGQSCVYSLMSEFGEDAPVSVTKAYPNTRGINLSDGVYYIGDDPANPKVGDVKISYNVYNGDELDAISVYGVQNNMSFCDEQNAEEYYALRGEMPYEEFEDEINNGGIKLGRSLIIFGLFPLALAALVVFLKNKKAAKKAAATAAALVFILAAIVMPMRLITHADFGDFGGDSDYGGGGWDSGGDSWDSGSDYGWGSSDDDHDYTYATQAPTIYYFYDFTTDSPYSGDARYFNIAGASVVPSMLKTAIETQNRSTGAGSVLFLIIGAIDGFIIRAKNSLKKKRRGPVAPGAQRTDAALLRSLDEYKALDPQFSEAEFADKLRVTYVDLQAGWQAKNLTPLRKYMTDAFYAQMDRQLNNYRRAKQTNIVKDIQVENVALKGWYQTEGNDVMVAELTAVIRDYVTSDETGSVVKGDPDVRKRMTYEYSLVRPTGTVSGGDATHEEICPNCGAPLEINSAGECAYCGSIIQSTATDWAISSIKGLMQRTLYNS